ncbi:MAG: GNAT family N-acetyltransferase [Phycisphaerae bacterium]|nr:GNAT family N-acetyltransferase [Phycisphaerae bacterium]
MIRLEPLEIRHAADFFDVADPELFVHSTQGPREWTVAGFEEEIATVNAIPDVVAFAMIAIAGPHAGRAIGRSTFMDIKPAHRGIEIGRTWIARAYHGTRVNPEAKYLMLRHAFETLAPTAIRVQITTSSSNLHSQAAIAKLGAVREGAFRNARILPPAYGRPEPVIRDWIVFSVLDSEWPTVKANLEARLRAMAATESVSSSR